MSCISCHSPHHAQTKEFLLVKAQPELCYTCHLQQKPQFAMPFHHRVNEVLCSAPIAITLTARKLPKQVRTSASAGRGLLQVPRRQAWPLCFRARTGERWRAAQSCHVTHGSPNPHMLKFSNVNMLCLQCHTTSTLQQRAGNAVVSQPGHPISSLHAVPRANSRVELRSRPFSNRDDHDNRMASKFGLLSPSDLACSPLLRASFPRAGNPARS